MSAPRSRTSKTSKADETAVADDRPANIPSGFDVTRLQVVGRVEFDDTGDMSPMEAAFRVIGQEPEAGTYQFPGPNENTVVVTVGYKNESDDDETKLYRMVLRRATSYNESIYDAVNHLLRVGKIKDTPLGPDELVLHVNRWLDNR